ncbi:hypothetical protein ABWI07_40140, partial [Actinomadura sp. NPDC000600]
ATTSETPAAVSPPSASQSDITIDNTRTPEPWVRAYALRFDLIRGVALPTDESLKLLHSILEDL